MALTGSRPQTAGGMSLRYGGSALAVGAACAALAWAGRRAAASRTSAEPKRRPVGAATLPARRVGPELAARRRLGGAVLAAGLAALGALLCLPSRRPGKPREAAILPEHRTVARQLTGGAALLAASVLADSAVEHYRGSFINPAMYLPPAIAAASLVNSLRMTLTPEAHGRHRTALHLLSCATGAAGVGYHIFDLVTRDGGISLNNLFYGAPIGAPAALGAAGLAGLAASHLVVAGGRKGAVTVFGLPVAPFLGIGSAVVMAGTVAEAGLLHFRGAYHDPFMFIPVTLPPAAAAALAAAIAVPGLRQVARWLLRLTAGAGVVGVGFHLYGLQRYMGGFHNWSQNLLQGPPLPAPPSFTGVAVAGLGALRLLDAA